MMVDIVSKGIVYVHLFLVAIMALAGFPQILIYTSLLWGACGHMAIPLCEEQFELVLLNVWKYRHLAGFGVVYILLLDNLQFIM